MQISADNHEISSLPPLLMTGDPRRLEAIADLELYTTQKFIKNSMLRRSAHSPETVKRTSKQKTQVSSVRVLPLPNKS